jgi:hypothetical protein
MRLNPPKKITFWISVAIAAVGVIGYVVHLIIKDNFFLGGISVALLAVAFVLLCLGLTLKGL